MLPDARTLTIKAAGHVPQLEQPAAFAAAVLEFLGE
jgi:pimeloyl-ACP methyl ester carboxylesterase